MKEVYREIRAYIDAHRNDMMALWEEIVNTESGSRQIEGVNMVGRILAREMKNAGISARFVEMENAGNMLVAEWNTESSKAPMLFIGHMDTVFKEGAAKENPFRIDENGMAHGPGVLDMKAGLVIALYAIRALQAVGYTDRPIKCVFAGDEENLHQFSTTKDAMAAEMTGAVAAFNFETGYVDDGIVVGRKGGGEIYMDIHGISSHSGIAPEKGRSAVLEAAYKIQELEACNDFARGKLINCGKLVGGIGANTIPGEATLTIGIRFPSTEIKNELLADIERIAKKSHVADTTAEVRVAMCMECMDTTDGVKALFDHFEKVADACGYGKVHAFQVGGVSDSGIAVVCGVPTLCGMGVRGTGNHTPHEVAEVESLFQRCIVAASAVYSLDQ